MAFNLTNTQAHIIPHQHPTSDITGLVELIQANAVVVSPTAPDNPGAGKLWYNTTKGVFNIWNGSAWILVGPEICPLTKAQYDALSAADKADGRFYLITDNDGTIYVEWENIDGRPYLISSTAPSTPAEGYLWYDTTDDVLKFYNGTDWNPVNTNTEYTGGTNVSVDPVTHEISATDTTYVAGDFDIKDLADSTDLRTTWSGKQDAINDLQTIRSGAAAGATAVQPLDNVSGLTNDAGYITNAVSDLTNYYTKTQTYTKAEVDQMITDFGGFEVVEQLPAVATANPHIIYLLGPIGTGGDQYEEWIVTDVTTPGHFESASTITDLTFNYSNTSDDFDFGGITNSYVGVKSITHSGDDINYTIFDENDSSSAPTYTNNTETPFVVKPDGGTEQWLMANPTGYTRNGSTYEGTLEVSYSASPLTWVSGSTTKTWTKIGETSVDLSNYFNTFTDTADSITPGSTNLFVTSSEKSTWSGKQDALVEGTGIDIDSSTNEISVDTTVIATKTDIANFFDKTSDDADDIDDTNSTNKFVTASEKSTWDGKQDALTAGDNITISSNTISADVNTKTFPMAVATKVADAQDAIDWVLDGNNALIKLDNRIYLLDKVENGVYYFKAVAYSNNGTNDTMTVTNIEVTVVSDTVTEVHIMGEAHGYLETNRNYSTPFVPTQDGHPATKKYVDDNVIQKSAVAPSNPTEGTVWYDTTNDVLKVYDGSNWNVTGKTYTAGTNIDITNDVISADTQFLLVDTLPAVAQADENKVYILDLGDRKEEWIAVDNGEPHFVSESTIDHESIDFTYDGLQNFGIWNGDGTIQNKYIGITNLQLSTSNRLVVVSDNGASCFCCSVDNDSEMPFIGNGPDCDSTEGYDNPYIFYSDMGVGQSGETASFDLYYSDTPLTWVAGGKEWIKVADLSDSPYVVVNTLPSVATADMNKIYILDLGDTKEEWIIKDLGQGGFSSATGVTGGTVTYNQELQENPIEIDGVTLENVYIAIDNVSTENVSAWMIGDDTTSVAAIDLLDITTPYCYDTLIAYPRRGLWDYSGSSSLSASADIYYSTTPITYRQGGKVWIKVTDPSSYLAKNNTTSYTPSGDYNPATKKYVDDRAVPTSGTTGYILTKTANGYEWAAAPSSGKYDIVTSSSEPSDHTVLWIKPGTAETSDEMYRYDDANSGWVLMGGVHKGADMPYDDFGKEGGFWLKESQDDSGSELLYYDENANGWVNVGGTYIDSNPPSSGNIFGRYGFWYDTVHSELKYYDHNNGWTSFWGVADAESVSTPGNFFATNSDNQIFYYESGLGWNPIGGIIYADTYSSSDVPTNKLWYDTTNDVFKYYNQSTADWEEVTKIYTPGDGIDIDTSNNNAISVDYSSVAASLAGTGLQLENISGGGYQIGIDTTVVATKSDIANLGSFEVVDTLPAVGTASEKTIYLLGPIGTGADKYEEWIVTEDSQQQKQWTKIGETSVDLSDVNTKTFYLTGTTGAENIAAAQEAYDWYAAGKNPIIEYTPERSGISNTTGLYFFSHYYNGNDLAFISGDLFDGESTSSGGRHISRRQLNIIADSSNVVTEIEKNTIIPVFNYLSTSSSNFNYTPSANYDPATKKYVDDNVVQKSSTAPSSYTEGTVWYDTTNDVLKVYDGTNWNEVGSGGAGDMLYADFNWSAKSGASITLDLNTTIEPTANFTVNAPATIKDGQIYVLRVQTGVDAYTMTLGTNITNPYNEDLTLSINTIAQFSFLGINNKLELQPSIEAVDISGKQDKATSGSAAPSTTPSYVGQQYVDTTNGKLYVALGTSSSSDWMEVGAGGGNVVAITQQEYDALTPAEKNDGKFRIITDSPSETLPFVEEMDDSPTQGIKIWAGTQAQYNNLQSVDPSGVYIILSSN